MLSTIPQSHHDSQFSVGLFKAASITLSTYKFVRNKCLTNLKVGKESLQKLGG